jgi:hypothetical protein
VQTLTPTLVLRVDTSKGLQYYNFSGDLNTETKILNVNLHISENRGWCESSMNFDETVKLSDEQFDKLFNQYQYITASKAYARRKALEEEMAIEKIRKEIFP